MSQFVKHQCRLLRLFNRSFQYRFVQQKFNYSQNPIPNTEVKFNRKKKYIYSAVLGVCCLGFAYYIKKEKEYGNLNILFAFFSLRNSDVIFVLLALMRERQKALKQAGIGGKWELFDSNGVKRTTDDFKGKWCMIYFGFTHCPG